MNSSSLADPAAHLSAQISYSQLFLTLPRNEITVWISGSSEHGSAQMSVPKACNYGSVGGPQGILSGPAPSQHPHGCGGSFMRYPRSRLRALGTVGCVAALAALAACSSGGSAGSSGS